jgi:hypothetical protein
LVAATRDPYSYAGGDPVNRRDARGLDDEDDDDDDQPWGNPEYTGDPADNAQFKLLDNLEKTDPNHTYVFVDHSGNAYAVGPDAEDAAEEAELLWLTAHAVTTYSQLQEEEDEDEELELVGAAKKLDPSEWSDLSGIILGLDVENAGPGEPPAFEYTAYSKHQGPRSVLPNGKTAASACK